MSDDRDFALEFLVFAIVIQFEVVFARLVSDSLKDLRAVLFAQVEQDIDARLIDKAAIGVRLAAHLLYSDPLDLFLGLLGLEQGVPVDHAHDALILGLDEVLRLHKINGLGEVIHILLLVLLDRAYPVDYQDQVLLSEILHVFE